MRVSRELERGAKLGLEPSERSRAVEVANHERIGATPLEALDVREHGRVPLRAHGGHDLANARLDRGEIIGATRDEPREARRELLTAKGEDRDHARARTSSAAQKRHDGSLARTMISSAE